MTSKMLNINSDNALIGEFVAVLHKVYYHINFKKYNI